jgi:phage terminase large subunit-like protein
MAPEQEKDALASDRRLLAELHALPPGEQARVLRSLPDNHHRELQARWSLWAHQGQVQPPGDWRVWLIRAGRGFGKTRAGAEWVSGLARHRPGVRIALVSGTIDDARGVMVEGPSGVLSVLRGHDPPRWRASAGVLTLRNEAQIAIYSAQAPEKLRGPEHDFAWCDELGKWGRGGEAAWDNLLLGLRLGEQPRVLVTTTPRPNALMRRVMAMPDLAETSGRTRDNPHLPDSFIDAVEAQYAGTRLGRQELGGELVDDVAGALWTRAMLEAGRVAVPPALIRVVVAVDPPAGIGGDACGIVAAGLGADGRGYVLEDASVAGASPERWARAVAGCAERHRAERVVAEKNQGGEMVRTTLLAADARLPLTLVHASRGKVARAEPVAALYESERVSHAGRFPALEDEMCGIGTGGDYAGPGRSPDRADALVWALTALMLDPAGRPGVREL